ncbi:flavin reductase family protein [Kineosporia succinea]|uniref:Flavin reductase (DIM6/NTAB) family NADH-FMN oxidoreductase RutF n=1 Tax=Kineosporia succinea TaxID=84632 RepID=A0ABT9NX19_9ACTN|nr:flavin reductase family protein [Kineosporia succinea]MDP9824973.1 flavin reductase (DIM6/NTAB) family NADH-FMN oxidoreductase RutF [Kineosporia succinea]
MTSATPDPHSESLNERFRAGFRHHAAGVSLVTCATPDGPVGLTASSVASVSAKPPMLSFSVARTSSAGAVLVSSERLAVTILGEDDVLVAAAFAKHGAERFTAEQGWEDGDGGLPVLKTAPVTMWGRPGRVIPAGEAWLVLAEIDRVEFGPACGPLLYHDRAYRSLHEVPVVLDRDAARRRV